MEHNVSAHQPYGIGSERPTAGELTPAEVYKQRVAAIRGERLPNDTWSRFGRASVIRGLRCHLAFARSEAVTALCSGARPEFSRARNARLIMSNVLPEADDMDDADRTRHPYCIWYPDFASEDTYRLLVARFPSMRYQVGRACAAAGYVALYHELAAAGLLLPDVSIAEEAREATAPGSRAIFDAIMAAPCRYIIMDDYTLSINLDSPVYIAACLNGDTDVRWKLNFRLSLQTHDLDFEEPRRESHACIEEDDRIDAPDTRASSPTGSDQFSPDLRLLTHTDVRLLYEPLPTDLPTVRKTLLIQMAAYEGNLDRYVRLARPLPIGYIELLCVIRGIYHNTTFARFWAAEMERNSPRVQRLRDRNPNKPRYLYSPLDCADSLSAIRCAVSARRIMINDTQEFHDGWPQYAPQPFLIWWPLRSHESTLSSLLELVPSMKKQVVVAVIICDYQTLWEYIDPLSLPLEDHYYLWLAAKNSRNSRYLSDIENNARELDSIEKVTRPWSYLSELEACLAYDMEPTERSLFSILEDGMSKNGFEEPGPYCGSAPKSGQAERYMWASKELLRKIEIYAEGWAPGPTSILESLSLLDEQ